MSAAKNVFRMVLLSAAAELRHEITKHSAIFVGQIEQIGQSRKTRHDARFRVSTSVSALCLFGLCVWSAEANRRYGTTVKRELSENTMNTGNTMLRAIHGMARDHRVSARTVLVRVSSRSLSLAAKPTP